jgi:rRNA maturation endonuclease Nob1
MNLFRKLGRQVGEFQAKDNPTAEESAVYQCENCSGRFSEQHPQCPECKDGNLISADQRE